MKTLKDRSLKFQLISVVVLLSVIPLLFLSVFSMDFLQKTNLKNTRERTEEITKNAKVILEKDIKNHMKNINEFSYVLKDNKYFDLEANNKDILVLMHQYLMGNKNNLNMYLIKDDGSFVGTDALPKKYEIPNFKNWGFLRMLNESDDTLFYSNYDQSTATFYNSFSIGKKITTADNDYYLILDVSTGYILNLIESVKKTTESYVQFVITSDNDRIIYNDSIFHSNIYYLNNVFRYERLDNKEVLNNDIKLDDMILVSDYSNDFNITVYGLIPKKINDAQISYLSLVIISLLLFTTIVSLAIGYYLTNSIASPIYDLLNNVKKYRPFKDENVKSKKRKYNNEIDELTYEFNRLLARIEKYRVEDLKQQELLRTSEIKSLMSQINPHFLNNTLDTIKWKAKLNNLDDISDMSTQLSILLKASMNTEPFVSIKEEVKFINSYTSLQMKRYSDRFNFNLDVDEDLLDYKIPKLILQPLVENAIIHSVEPNSNVVNVMVSIKSDEDNIVFLVKDDGVGFDENQENKADSIGISNIKNRLNLHYNDDASFEIISDNGVLVTIKIKKNRLKKVSL